MAIYTCSNSINLYVIFFYHLLTFSEKMLCKQSLSFVNKSLRFAAETTVTYSIVSVRHHHAIAVEVEVEIMM